MERRVITFKQFLMLFNPIRKILITQLRIRIILNINIMLTINTSRKFLNQRRHIRILNLISKIITINLIVSTLIMYIEE